MMKKIPYALAALFLLVSLAACGAASGAEDAASEAVDSAADLSPELELLVGTLKLEDTELAVTTDQAAELLPLWQVLLSLENSGTAADQEIEAVLSQIRETMTSGQLEAIADMELTRQDEFAVMQSLGMSPNFGGGMPAAEGTPAGPDGMGFPAEGGAGGFVVQGNGSPPGGAPGAAMPSGGGPGGGMPSGGQQGGSGLDPSQIATLQARGTPESMGNVDGLPIPLVQALIDLLQEKIAP